MKIHGAHAVTGTFYNRRGVNARGFTYEGVHKRTGTRYDPRGYDELGFDRSGRHKATNTAWDRRGFDVHGIHRETGGRYDIFDVDACGYQRNGWYVAPTDMLAIHRDTATAWDPDGYNSRGERAEPLDLPDHPTGLYVRFNLHHTPTLTVLGAEYSRETLGELLAALTVSGYPTANWRVRHGETHRAIRRDGA